MLLILDPVRRLDSIEQRTRTICGCILCVTCLTQLYQFFIYFYMYTQGFLCLYYKMDWIRFHGTTLYEHACYALSVNPDLARMCHGNIVLERRQLDDHQQWRLLCNPIESYLHISRYGHKCVEVWLIDAEMTIFNKKNMYMKLERFDYMVDQFMSMSTCPEVTWVNQEDLDLRMLPLYWRYPNFPRGVPDNAEEDEEA